MNTREYKAILNNVLLDLAKAIEKREDLADKMLEINSRIDSLRESAYSVGQLCHAEPDKEFPNLFGRDISPDTGFTDAIREIFVPNVGLTPVQVKIALGERGFKITQYKNPLASIHTILKRLVKSGELYSTQDDEDEPTIYFKLTADVKEEIEDSKD